MTSETFKLFEYLMNEYSIGIIHANPDLRLASLCNLSPRVCFETGPDLNYVGRYVHGFYLDYLLGFNS